jgi:FKBP-type peptidyl-prolyl cis-trans isomerase
MRDVLKDCITCDTCVCRVSVNGEVFDDTNARGKPIVFPFKSRSFAGGLSTELEEVIAGMRAGGVRRCTIQAEMGSGGKLFALQATRHAEDKHAAIPTNGTLDYEVSLVRVSIPP